MEKIDFRDVYIENVLGDIKRCIQYKIELVDGYENELIGKRIEKADKKMCEILKDILLHTGDSELKSTDDSEDKLRYNFFIFQDSEDLEAKKKFKCYLVLYYTALYFGTLDLLRKLFRSGFSFGTDPENLMLCVLDSRLVDYFPTSDEYLKCVEKNSEAFEPFYESMQEVEYADKKKYFDKFAAIVSTKSNMPSESLTKEKLDMFDEETYLAATSDQIIGIINQTNTFLEKKNIVRVNDLIRNTDFAYSYGEYSDTVYNLFRDEELLDTDAVFGRYLARASKVNPDFKRLRQLYHINIEVAQHDLTFNDRFLESFDDEDIAEMDYLDIWRFATYHSDCFKDELTREKEVELRKVINDFRKKHGLNKKTTKNNNVKSKVKGFLWG